MRINNKALGFVDPDTKQKQDNFKGIFTFDNFSVFHVNLFVI